jgi:hypothetical protein
MQTRNIDEIVKEVHALYNQDKLPAQQKTEEQIESMIKDHFLYLKKYFQKPYAIEFNMEKVARFKIRYRHVRKEINDLVKDLKAIRDAKRCASSNIPNKHCIIGSADKVADKVADILSHRNRWLEPNEKKSLFDIESDMKAELKYWWILKQKYMDIYTKTGKYKRLQALRKMWQERNEAGQKVDIRMKEDYKPYIKTQMPTDMAKWNIDTE